MSQHDDNCNALAICLIANVPVVLWGDPGQGKTSIIEDFAADLGMHLETVIASIREPSDFSGLPVIDPVTQSVNLAPPAWAKRLVDAGGGIQFYDEISTAPPAVQAALLRPILGGWVGDLKLPDSVRTVAAANPTAIAADGWDLAPPMANRFTHLNWALSAETVRDGFATGWQSISVPEVDPDEVARLLRETMITLGAFLGTRRELVSKMPESSDESGRAFPTPRSWESAARLYATAKAARANSNVVQMLIGGTVGDPAAREFLTFVANLDLPDPEALLANPESLVVPSDRGDKVYAITAAVWAATQSDNTAERWVACGRIFGRVADAGHADIAYSFGTRWAKDRPVGGMPTADIVRSLAPILTELNLLTAQG